MMVVQKFVCNFDVEEESTPFIYFTILSGSLQLFTLMRILGR